MTLDRRHYLSIPASGVSIGIWEGLGWGTSSPATAPRTVTPVSEQENGMIEVFAVDHLVLNVADVEISARWYEQVLGMRRVTSVPPTGGAPRVSMRFGSQRINLRPTSATQSEWFTAHHIAKGATDICFLVGVDPEMVVGHLRDCNVAVEQGPVVKHGASGNIRSVYCRDPDGSLIEISSYA